MLNEVRFGWRMLAKNPGYTAAAVLTLAFGIAVNINLFAMISAFFLQPLRVARPEELVMVLQRSDAFKMPHGHSYLDYLDYRDQCPAFSDMAAYFWTPANLSLGGQAPERNWIELVSGNYFRFAGVTPIHGRLLLPGEGQSPGADPVMVLNHGYWQRRFGGDPAVVGKTIRINGSPFTIIGIVPPSFGGLSWALDVGGFVPITMAPAIAEAGEHWLKERGAPMFRLMGRLKPGVTLPEARAAVQVVAAQLKRDFPEQHKGSQVLVLPERQCRPDPTFADFMPFFSAMFLAMVGLVLFIACANVANLMLSRATARRREMVMRSALGASRWDLVRQLLVESLQLALLAGVIGLLVAAWSGRLFAGFAPQGDMPLRVEQSWDWRVYGFTVLVSLLAGLGTGLVPALQASRFELIEALKEGGTGRFVSGRHRFRNGLVITQVALSLVVLVCAGLFLHSLQKAKGMALGFRPEQLLSFSVDLGLQRYEDARGTQFFDRLAAQIRALPTVTAFGVTQHVPFDYGFRLAEVFTDPPPPEAKNGGVFMSGTSVGYDFIQALGLTVLRGRAFDPRDTPSTAKVAMVNETMARTMWPNQDPLGKRFRLSREGDELEVVGIMANGKYVMLAEEPRGYFYLPWSQHYGSPASALVRTSGDPQTVSAAVRQAVASIDPNLPVFNVRTMQEHIRTSAFGLMPLRAGATLAMFQGVIGLLLAVLGLYAVVAYTVVQRTQEIGVRMALGAQPSNVLRLVVREGMRLAIVGLMLGGLGALGMAFLLSRWLYGLTPVDLAVLVGVGALLLGVAALACYLPARRATTVDPLTALRYE
jgi:predicted permease